MVITFANHKGGTGKTTSVLTVAHLLHTSGQAVSVLDLDAPSSFREAGASQSLRLAQALDIQTFTLDGLPDEVPGDLIVDGPPDIADRGLEMVLDFTDYLIIPSTLSQYDLEVTEVFYQSAAAKNKGVLFTRVPHYSQDLLIAKRAELEGKGVRVLKTSIPRLEIFEHAARDGTTVAGLNTYLGRTATKHYQSFIEELEDLG